MQEKNRFLVVIIVFMLFVFAVPIVSLLKEGNKEGTIEDLKELVSKEEMGIVYLGSATCPYCEQYNPIIEKVAKEERFDYLYLDLDRLSEAEKVQLRQLINKETEAFGVPLTLIVGYNGVIAELPGYNSSEALISFLIENNFIKGETSSVEGYDEEIVGPIEEAINKETKTLLYLGSSSCGYCTMYDPVINEVMEEYDLTYLYIDMDKISYETYFMIMSLIKEEGIGTPYTAVIGNGGVIDVQKGYVDNAKLIDFLQNNNMIE